MTARKRVSKKNSSPVIDPYLPEAGNFGYRVSRYELDLEYKTAINRLSGSAAITAVTLAEIKTFTLDLADALSVSKVSLNGKRPAHYRTAAGKLHITLAERLPAGAAMTVGIRYSGNPRPNRTPWGDVGFEELTEGVLVAGQPNGASSWFPCDDHPAAKASFRVQIATESSYFALANGKLLSRRPRAGMTTWVYEQSEPTSTYLITLQIGVYNRHRLAKNGVEIFAVLPDRLRREFAHDFGRQPQMMKLFTKLFGPYPLATGYTVVVTDDDLEIPLEAQGISIFGANHCDGSRKAERLIAHELAHQWFGNSVTVQRWRHIWLHEGFACYAEWLWSEASGGPSADALASRHHAALALLPQDLTLAQPAPAEIFDDRVYKRGALTVHAVRRTIGDTEFRDLVRVWTHRHRGGTVTTADFRDLAAEHATATGGEALAETVRTVLTDWLDQPALPELPGHPRSGPARLLDHLRRPVRSGTPS